ncbi:DsbA family oxidoreductase [Herbaspirillum sp. WKF16]|jgi:predicted DsbA family dithiol-disulfide isomerase|uniref:DsbA family oxidoreductase n=1 Tax=Herbaspirillum sp. WKF16 TaxID=3028312 RepID=UPI0023A93D65|nr:DsbA family oxidoreductase [Herbaspirillum sp. WKF16]WDZ95056.1 DsbA family oxidoreductase [Herbaspirillum sp. WKF16]
MSKTLKIDFVSDVVCPWCAVGLGGLDAALERISQEAVADITFHPFELNPNMPADGQEQLEHITGKYGISPEQARANREQIRLRAATVGFAMNRDDASRVYNTFDAHRLLAWAKEEGKQVTLKRALLKAYFTDGLKIDDVGVLAALAESAGLDGAQARAVLASDRFAQEVKEEEALWASRGIRSVPAVIVNDRYLIEGGQPPEAFEQQLRAILAAPAAA